MWIEDHLNNLRPTTGSSELRIELLETLTLNMCILIGRLGLMFIYTLRYMFFLHMPSLLYVYCFYISHLNLKGWMCEGDNRPKGNK